MDSPNGWTRDTVQRLIVQAGDASVAPKLVRLASESPNPKVRVQALATLDGLGALSVASLTRALADSHPAVREHAVRLSEVFAKASGQGTISARERAALEEQLLGRIRDESVRVRYQLAFTLGEWPDAAAGQGLVQLHAEAADQPHLLTAVLSSAAPHVRVMIDTTLREYRERPPVTLFQQLLSLAVVRKENGSLVRALPQIGERRGDRYQVWQFAAAAGFLDGVERDHQSLASFERRAEPEMRTALKGLNPLFKAARAVAQEGTAMEPERVAAIGLLGRGAEPKEDLLTLTELLRPQLASQVRTAALNTLKRLEDPDIAALLLKGWRSYEPSMRTDVLGALLSRSEWTGELLAELEAGAVSSAQISPADQQKMLGSANASIRTRAEKLFGITSNRRQIIQEYHDVLEITGDGRSGAGLFRQNCATCHRLREEGVNVGPDLGALANKSTQNLLVAILAPSQAVEARYVNYTALTRSERELSGILVAETPSSVTLRSAGGTEETVLRSDLQDLSSSGLSLMPEGFEKVMSKQQLADLIAFLTGHD
jgi:putative heme-binding domain-containing protein